MKKSYLSILPIFCIVLFTNACGPYKKEVERYYRFFVYSTDTKVVEQVKTLVLDFNHCANRKIFTLVSDESESNSSVILTAGLQKRDGKVGWGQWIRETNQENPLTTPGRRPKKTFVYSGSIEMDKEFFYENMNKSEDYLSYDLKKLWNHEAGHVIGLGHNEDDQNDVMYPDIGGQKNFDRFCKQIQTFLTEEDS